MIKRKVTFTTTSGRDGVTEIGFSSEECPFREDTPYPPPWPDCERFGQVKGASYHCRCNDCRGVFLTTDAKDYVVHCSAK